MAEKTLFLSSDPKHYGIIGCKTVNDKYSNLNLNCNYFDAGSDTVSSKAYVTNEYKTKNISNSGKKNKGCNPIIQKRDCKIMIFKIAASINTIASVHKNDDLRRKKDSIFWKKSSNNLSTIFSKDAFCDSYKKKELNEGNDSTSAKNSSTLSLHIAAYEDSIEASAPPLDEGNESKSDLCQKWNNEKQLLVLKESFNQNPFEFPRQQENGEKTSKPEITQFKASQKLLNPNESMASNQAEKVTSSLVPPSRSLIKKGNPSMEIDDTPSTVFSSSFDYSDSDTSLHYIQNESEVLCCINGPGELPMSKRINDKLLVSVLYYLENGASTSSNELEKFANLMVDRSTHPRAGLSINVLQMRDNGSRLSTALNAVSLALLDSAIPFDVLLAGVEVALLSDNSIAVNPTKSVEEKAVANALIVFSLMDKQLQVCGFQSRGSLTPDFYCGAVEAAKPAAKEVFDYFRKTMNVRLLSTSTL